MSAPVEMPLSISGHVAKLQVCPADGGGYRVVAVVDGREIAQKYCSDWRRVERFRCRMQMWLQSAGADAAADHACCPA